MESHPQEPRVRVLLNNEVLLDVPSASLTPDSDFTVFLNDQTVLSLPPDTFSHHGDTQILIQVRFPAPLLGKGILSIWGVGGGGGMGAIIPDLFRFCPIYDPI